MSNPNYISVFDPKGEHFEMVRANARDLVEHAGWTYSPPKVIEKIVQAVVAPEAVETPEPEVIEEEEAPVTEEEDSGPTADEDKFSFIKDREQAVAYLAENFPEFKPHHRAGFESLIEKIVELSGK